MSNRVLGLSGVLVAVTSVAMLGLLSCQDRSAGRTPTTLHTVANVNGQPTYAEEVALAQADTQTPADALRVVVNRKLMAKHAIDIGIAESTETRAQLEWLETEHNQAKEKLLVDRLFESLKEDFAPEPSAIREHYERVKSRYFDPTFAVNTLKFESKELAEARLAEGRALESSGPGLGTVGPLPLRRFPRSLARPTAQLLRVGDQAVAETDEGWLLLELKSRSAEARPFESVKAEVEESLRVIEAQKALSALAEAERGRADIEVHEDVLGDEGLWSRLGTRDP